MSKRRVDWGSVAMWVAIGAWLVVSHIYPSEPSPPTDPLDLFLSVFAFLGGIVAGIATLALVGFACLGVFVWLTR